MKRIIAVALLGLMSFATNAAPITITFDDPTNETYAYFSSFGRDYMTITKDGFVVTAEGIRESAGDREAFGATIEDGGGGGNFPITIQRSDGGAFTLHAYDYNGPGSVSYRLADGSYVDGQYGGSGLLLNITYFEFSPTPVPYALVTLDNIVVSAVPIPAAVWLFASGLALLGWVRRCRMVAAV